MFVFVVHDASKTFHEFVFQNVRFQIMTSDFVLQHVYDKKQRINTTFGVLVLVFNGMVFVKYETNWWVQLFALFCYFFHKSHDFGGCFVAHAVKIKNHVFFHVDEQRHPMASGLIVFVQVEYDSNFEMPLF